MDLNFNLDKSDGEAERRAAGVKAQVEGSCAGGKAHVEVAAVGASLRQGAR